MLRSVVNTPHFSSEMSSQMQSKTIRCRCIRMLTVVATRASISSWSLARVAILPKHKTLRLHLARPRLAAALLPRDSHQHLGTGSGTRHHRRVRANRVAVRLGPQNAVMLHLAERVRAFRKEDGGQTASWSDAATARDKAIGPRNIDFFCSFTTLSSTWPQSQGALTRHRQCPDEAIPRKGAQTDGVRIRC